MYLRVRVSILIFSPVLMKSGACTVMPVSSVMAFWTLLAESPRTPSGASVTVRMTLAGSSTETTLPSTSVTVTATPSTGYNFVNWTEGATVVSTSASYTFTASGNRTLVANFTQVPTYAITTSASPTAGGATS